MRHAARVIVVDESDRVLLFHGRSLDGKRSFWIAPGGGLEGDEDAATAARRELHEETGLRVDLDRPVWTRVHTFPWIDGLTQQHETFFVARVRAEEVVAPAGDDYTFEHRWWSLDEIRASDAAFAPRRMAKFLPPLLRGELPGSPVDVGP